MADSLELKEVELDYEAEEEDRSDTPRAGSSARNGEIDNTVKEDVAEQKDEIPDESELFVYNNVVQKLLRFDVFNFCFLVLFPFLANENIRL